MQTLADFGKVPIPVTDESQDRPFTRMHQESKAALRNCDFVCLALAWLGGSHAVLIELWA